jgi:cytochrome P450
MRARTPRAISLVFLTATHALICRFVRAHTCAVSAPRSALYSIPKTTWYEVLTGTLASSVTTGHICRKYMGSKSPNLLRFDNGILAGWLRDFILVKDPQMARQVMEEKNTLKPDGSYRVFRRFHGYFGGRDFLSFRSHKHPIYARNRVLAYKTLIKRMVDHYSDIFVPTTQRFINRLEKNCEDHDDVTIDATEQMHVIATALLTGIAFDESSTDLDQDLFECTVWMVNDMLKRPIHNAFPFLDRLPTPTNKKLWRYQARLVSAIQNMIARKRALAREGTPGDDVVSVLGAETANTDRDLIGILGIFFFAGFDTTANTMAMLLHHLALNQDVQDRARADVFSTLGTNSNGAKPQTLDSLFHCKYLLACIKETLRMFPTVPMISREVTERHADGVCPRFQEGKTFGVNINMFGLHYNAKGWSRPDEFLPERWLDPTIDMKKDPEQRVYCPFAMGKRQCLGRQFAYVEMLTVVAMVLQKFRLHTVHGRAPRVVEGGTLLIHNLQVQHWSAGWLLWPWRVCGWGECAASADSAATHGSSASPFL